MVATNGREHLTKALARRSRLCLRLRHRAAPYARLCRPRCCQPNLLAPRGGRRGAPLLEPPLLQCGGNGSRALSRGRRRRACAGRPERGDLGVRRLKLGLVHRVPRLPLCPQLVARTAYRGGSGGSGVRWRGDISQRRCIGTVSGGRCRFLQLSVEPRHFLTQLRRLVRSCSRRSASGRKA